MGCISTLSVLGLRSLDSLDINLIQSSLAMINWHAGTPGLFRGNIYLEHQAAYFASISVLASFDVVPIGSSKSQRSSETEDIQRGFSVL